MTRTLTVDEAAQDEAEAQASYYVDRAGAAVALAFVAELEAIYRGLIDRRFVGVNHLRVKFRLPVKRVLMERFPFAVGFFAEADAVRVVFADHDARTAAASRSRCAGYVHHVRTG